MFIAQNAIKKRIGLFLAVIGAVLILFAVFFNYNYNSENKIQQQLKLIENNLVKSKTQFSKLIKDSVLIHRLILGQESLEDIATIKKNNFSFYLYKQDELSEKEYLRYWNSTNILPDSSLQSKNFIDGLYHLSNGYYYVQKMHLPYNQAIYAYAFSLIKYDFAVQTEFINNIFPINSYLHQFVVISNTPTKEKIYAPNKKEFLYVKILNNERVVTVNSALVFIKLIGAFIFLFGLFSIIIAVIQPGEFVEVIYLGIFLCLFRFFCQYFDSFFQYHLTDLANYQFNYFDFIHSNIGWLLMDVILMFIFCIATYNIINEKFKQDKSFNINARPLKKYKDVFKFSIVFSIVSFTFLAIELLKDIILHSGISFDIANFESLSVLTVVGFLLIGCIVFNYYLLSRIGFKILYNYLDVYMAELFLYTSLSSLAWLTILIKSEYLLFYSYSLIFILLFFTTIYLKKKKNNRFKFKISQSVFWVNFFAIFVSICVVYFANKKEIIIRKSYAMEMLRQPDSSTREIMNTFFDSITLYNSKSIDIEKVQNYCAAFTSKANRLSTDYQYNVIVYDSLDQSIYNPSQISFNTLNELKEKYGQNTSLDNIFYIQITDSVFAYLNYKEFENETGNLKTVVISTSKTNPIQLEALKLFLKFAKWELFNPSLYQYAIYKQNTLVASNSRYPFTLSINPSKYPTRLFQEENKNGYSLLWYKPNYTDLLVIVRKTDLFIQFLTIFSYFFCLFFLIILGIEFLPFAYNLFLKDKKNIPPLFAQTIRKQVYTTFVILSIIIFVVISIATIQFYILASEEYNNDRVKSVVANIKSDLQSVDFNVNNHTRQLNKNEKDLAAEVAQLAKSYNLDLNVYDATGKLIASSQLDFYKRGFVSEQINDIAFFNLLRLKKIEYNQKEKIANLSFSNMYAPILDQNDKLKGYVAVPYFSMNQELGQRIVDVLITLLNLYAFIFLVTSLISLFVTERITRSLAIIGSKMQKVDFLKDSTPIEWHRKDEIGKLVDEYNKMLFKLKESVTALTKMEREVAWREMAKQVAHEIKNPLTPMKLNLQYLQRAIKNDQPNITELTNKVATGMVEQIDHLSRIASEFLEFANIYKSKKEKINLHESITALEDIYSLQPNVVFKWHPIFSEVYVLGDKTHINRLFTNLIINAIDAKDGDIAYITITEFLQDNFIKIIVADKGKGFEKEALTHLFEPNFTTKSSGTGLGLAMCKSIVEQMKGEIKFASDMSSETRICILLPIFK